MRDYQAKKNNPYALPDTLYKRVLALIRDYDRLKDEYEYILDSGSSPSFSRVYVKRSTISKPSEHKALRLSVISCYINAVEKALDMMPEEYRDGILNNVKYSDPYPYIADISTYKRWKQRYLYQVAENLDYI